MKNFTKKVKNKIKKLGWSIYECEGGIELSQYSPLGEDFHFYVENIEDLKNYCEEFDPEEHAEIFIEMRGQNGVPSSIRDLLDDAESIREMLQELLNCIKNIYKNLSMKDIKILKSFGERDEDLPQIDRAISKTIYELENENEVKRISRKEAIKILGKEEFLSGISRSAFHWSSVRKKDNKIIYFDSYKLFEE